MWVSKNALQINASTKPIIQRTINIMSSCMRLLPRHARWNSVDGRPILRVVGRKTNYTISFYVPTFSSISSIASQMSMQPIQLYLWRIRFQELILYIKLLEEKLITIGLYVCPHLLLTLINCISTVIATHSVIFVKNSFPRITPTTSPLTNPIKTIFQSNANIDSEPRSSSLCNYNRFPCPLF